MASRLIFQLLCVSSLLWAFATADTGGGTGRELLATQTATVTAALQPACEAETAYGNLAKNAAGYRGSCATPQGVLVPCDVTGVKNFTVNQGDSLTVTFAGASSTYVFLGGSLNDGFLNGAGCFIKTTTGTASMNSITTSSLTGFTFTPTGAVCSQFYNNVIGTLSVLAFDTSFSEFKDGSYYAAACKFDVGVVIVPNPNSALSADQLFPLQGGAAGLSGSMWKMLAAAVVGAIVLLSMLQ